MSHTAVSKCLASSFIKSGAMKSTSCDEASVTCSRLGTSIATVLVSSDNVDVETLASAFMKHKASTCHEYYVVKYAQLERHHEYPECATTHFI